ncbi:MAG: glycosyltransferase [Pelobacteraceae bacterium]
MAHEVTLSVVLPSYMEEENLRQLLPRITEVLSGLCVPSEVLVVDSMIPLDATREVCDASGVTYLNRSEGDYYGDAVRTGIRHASGTFVIFMDADGSHPPEFIRNLWGNAVENDSDVVIASRYVDGGATDNSRVLVLMSLIVNVIYALVLNLRCKDVSNSFKLYRANHLKRLQLYCKNFDIVEEILFKIRRDNPTVRFLEIPFTFRKRMFGNTKRNLFAFVFSFIVTLLKLRFGR